MSVIRKAIQPVFRSAFRGPFDLPYADGDGDPAPIIQDLFTANGWDGAYFDTAFSNSLFQDSSGTTPAGNGDTAAYWKDLTGNGRHLTIGTASKEPLVGDGLEFDGVDDELASNIVTSAGHTSGMIAAVFSVPDSASFEIASIGSGDLNALRIYVDSLKKVTALVASTEGVRATATSETAPTSNILVTALWTGGFFRTRVNGVEIATPSRAGTVDFNQICIRDLSGGQLMEGSVFAVAATIGVVPTGQDLTDLENALMTNHGVTP